METKIQLDNRYRQENMGQIPTIRTTASTTTKIWAVRQGQTKWKERRGLQNIPLAINHKSASKCSRPRKILKVPLAQIDT